MEDRIGVHLAVPAPMPLGRTTARKVGAADGATLPTSSLTYPVNIPICGTTGATCVPAILASAPAISGMGAADIASDWWLRIPANAHAGTYTPTPSR
jgi:hypothetical protein